MMPSKKAKVITANERDGTRTMIMHKDKYQQVVPNQQISACVNIPIQVILLCNLTTELQMHNALSIGTTLE